MEWWQQLGFSSEEEAIARGESEEVFNRTRKPETRSQIEIENARINDRIASNRSNNAPAIVAPNIANEITRYIIVQGAGGRYEAKADPGGTYTDATVNAEVSRLNAQRDASLVTKDESSPKNVYNPPIASDIIPNAPDPITIEKGLTAREEAKLRFPYLDDRLIDIYVKSYVDTGDSELAILSMRSDPMMETVYGGITKADGTLRMTEQEYIVVKEFMQLQLRNFNLNPTVFEEDVVQAISGDVSAQEFSDRLSAGYEGIVNNIPQVKEIYLREFNLDLNEESIFGMFISPQLSTKVLENQIRSSQILAEAETAMGSNALTTATAQSFARQGLTQTRAREALQAASVSLGNINLAATQQNRENIGVSEFVQAQALGDAQYQQQLGRITQQLLSESSVSAGAQQLRTGEVVGLVEG